MVYLSVFMVYFSDQSIHTFKHIYISQCICSQPHSLSITTNQTVASKLKYNIYIYISASDV